MKAMKKLLILASLLALLVLPAKAQDTNNTSQLFSGPGKTAWDFLTASSTNWMVVPYGIYDSGSKTAGAGVAVGYKLSDYVIPTLRLDYVDRQVWMPSASLQLQLPVTIMGKFTAIPFTFGGIATPLSGQGTGNGSAVAIVGAGLAVKLSNRLDLVGDIEKWTGAGFKDFQYRAGIVWKF